LTEKKDKLALNTDFDSQIFREIIRRHWFLPIVYILLFSSFALFYLRYTKPVYRSSAKLQIIEEDRVGDLLGSGNIVKDDRVLSKEVELLKSDVLFGKVLSQLNIETSIYAEGDILTQNLYRSAPFEVIIYKLTDSSLINQRIDVKLINNTVQLSTKNKIIGRTEIDKHLVTKKFDLFIRGVKKKHIVSFLNENNVFFIINNKKSLVKELRPNLSVKVKDAKAKTIEISYEYDNPRLCYDIVNGVLQQYLKWERDSKQNNVNKTIEFINSQIDSLSNILKISKDSLNNYRRETKILNPESIGKELSDDINELNNMLISFEEELLTLNLISNKINKNPNRLEIYRLIP